MQNRGVARERATELYDRRAAQVQADKVSQEKMAAACPDLLAKHPQQFQFQHFSGGTGLPTFGLERPDGTRLLLQWRHGQVTVLRASVSTSPPTPPSSRPSPASSTPTSMPRTEPGTPERRKLARHAKSLILASATRHNGDAGSFTARPAARFR
jgi:hypothetical protein